MSIVEKRKPSKAHCQGVVALVKHRGNDNFKDDLARSLYTAVYSEAVSPLVPTTLSLNNRLNFKQVTESIQRGIPPLLTPSEWQRDSKDLRNNTASRLTGISEEVANVRSWAKVVFDSSPDILLFEIDAILQVAHQVDHKLVAWADSVPLTWIPKPASDISPTAVAKFQALEARMDIYPSVFTVSIWNNYRFLRIVTQLLIMSCLAQKEKMAPASMPLGPQSHFLDVRGLVNDICASVPFCMGTKVSNETAVEYPTAAFDSRSAKRGNAAWHFGGWLLLAPLVDCLDVPILEERQRQWIVAQVYRIRNFYGITDELPARLTKSPEGINRIDGLQPPYREGMITSPYWQSPPQFEIGVHAYSLPLEDHRDKERPVPGIEIINCSSLRP